MDLLQNKYKIKTYRKLIPVITKYYKFSVKDRTFAI